MSLIVAVGAYTGCAGAGAGAGVDAEL